MKSDNLVVVLPPQEEVTSATSNGSLIYIMVQKRTGNSNLQFYQLELDPYSPWQKGAKFPVLSQVLGIPPWE